MAGQRKRDGKFFAGAMAILTTLISMGVLNGPNVRKAMQDFPETFQETTLPATPADAPLPVTVTVEQTGKVWAGSVPRVK